MLMLSFSSRIREFWNFSAQVRQDVFAKWALYKFWDYVYKVISRGLNLTWIFLEIEIRAGMLEEVYFINGKTELKQ